MKRYLSILISLWMPIILDAQTSGFNFMNKEFYNAFRHEKQDTNPLFVHRDSIILPVIDTSEKNSSSAGISSIEMSEIMFGKKMATGIIHIDVPENAECNIKIFSPSDNILLYNSDQQRNFSLFPGTYDLEISGVAVKNIPLEKGMDTRIKSGTLHFNYNLPWTLYDGNKLKILYSSSLPKKVEFPKGIYQVEINGMSHLIEIRDGETLEYDSTKEVVQPLKLNISDSTGKVQFLKSDSTTQSVQSPKININDSSNSKSLKNNVADIKKWEMKPGISKVAPKIFINIPRNVECITSILQYNSEKEVTYSGALTNERNFHLQPGSYDVKLSGSIIKNIPVQKGMDTRIKAGILNVVTSGIWTLYDENKNQVYFSTTEKKIGLPTGIYQIEINGNTKPVLIKDGETVTVSENLSK